MKNGRWLSWLILACSAALLAPLVRPLLRGRVFVYNDLAWFHLPMRFLYRQALHANDTVLWTPAIFSGFYTHGEGQTGLFHPWHQLLYRALPLASAFDLELIANYVAAFGGMWWLLRRLRFGHPAALCGAMLFAFSGFTLLHHHHLNMVAVVAHMPWLLAAADLVIAGDSRNEQRVGFAVLALLLGSAFLLGFPQAVWWDALALGAFALLRAGETGRWRRLLPCAGAVAVGILLGGLQIVPTADAAAHSMRAETSREFALSFSLHPYNLVQLWSPYAFREGAFSNFEFLWFHEFGIYSGAILPVALAWVWIRRAAIGRRALIAGLTGFAVLGLVLALGRFGGLAGLLTHVPVLDALRAPARYVVLAQVALTILAAFMVDDLVAIAEGRREAPSGPLSALWIPAALALIVAIGIGAALLPEPFLAAASADGAARGVAIVTAVTLLVWLAGRRHRWALGALVIATAADLGAYGIGFVYREPPRTIPSLIQAVPPAPGSMDDRYAAAPDAGPYRSNLLVMRGYRLTNGYVGLFPASVRPFDDETARRLSGTRWLFTNDGDRLLVEGGVARVRLLDLQGRDAAGTLRVVVDRPGHLVVQVEAPDARLVAFTERFHHGWSATIDGAPQATTRVEGDFLGTVINSGAHRVELRFTPRSFRDGALVSAFGAGLLAAIVVSWRRPTAGDGPRGRPTA
jgi:hypothetical protein